MESIRKTQLYTQHKSAKLTAFAGFEMPISYKGTIPEHMAVRNNLGIFDISHMGRVLVTGPDAEGFLNYVVTNDVSKLAPSAAQYSVMCLETGGTVDDFVIYRLEAERFLVVFNASNREKDFNWLVGNSRQLDVKIEDISDNVAMLAVQGPLAAKVLQEISTATLSEIERFKCGHSRMAGVDVFLSRTGYTGEDGFEVFIWDATLAKPEKAVTLWTSILEAGKASGVEPCGLGARDTLRLEAGLCLYGNDIDEGTTPLEAGLGFVVKLQKDRFIGKEALLKQKTDGTKRKRIGLQIIEPGIPRPGFEIISESGEAIGRLTSGTYSPLLKCGIGMGYVKASNTQEGTIVNVNIRDRLVKAKIRSFPFYDASRYGSRRKTA